MNSSCVSASRSVSVPAYVIQMAGRLPVTAGDPVGAAVGTAGDPVGGELDGELDGDSDGELDGDGDGDGDSDGDSDGDGDGDGDGDSDGDSDSRQPGLGVRLGVGLGVGLMVKGHQVPKHESEGKIAIIILIVSFYNKYCSQLFYGLMISCETDGHELYFRSRWTNCQKKRSL